MPFTKSGQKIRDYYAIKPDAPIYMKEFGFYVLDRWIKEGHMKPRSEVADYNAYQRELFGFDDPGLNWIFGLGWCEGAFMPEYEKKVLSDCGDYEIVQDSVGRHVKCFKGRRSGFMPEYVDHPVKDRRTWEEDVKWRMDPKTAGRETATKAAIEEAVKDQPKGNAIVQMVSGGYMYLRSLIGPENLLYAFYDMPDVVHDCMQTWLTLAESVIARHQSVLKFDEVFFGEDICYNHGSLISPDMMREFLFPYYQQLFSNMKKNNGGKKLHFQIDTDGYLNDVIDVYAEIGVDAMSPFEVASGCDIVKTAYEYPELLVTGGIDKRILAESKDAIDRHLEAIMPAMRRRGGYIPTCDHGVPEEVSFENYMHYRKRMKEYCE